MRFSAAELNSNNAFVIVVCTAAVTQRPPFLRRFGRPASKRGCYVRETVLTRYVKV